MSAGRAEVTMAGRGNARWLSAALIGVLAWGPGVAAPGAWPTLIPAAAESSPRWGWLGVRIRDLSEQEMDEISMRHGIREGFGAVIVEVIPETPAAAAGLRSGDLLVAFRDRPVVDTRTLQRLVAAGQVGDNVTVTVLRRGEGRRRLALSLGPMPEPMAAERVAAEFGFRVRDPEPQPELGGGRPSAGPAVAAVLRGSAAEAAGLKVGDVLLEINGRPVLTLEAARQALVAASLETPLPLTVVRGDDRVSMVLDRPRLP
jgi:serine protease Do